MGQKFSIEPQEFFQEIDLKEFLNSIWRSRWRIAFVTLLFAAVAIFGVLSIPVKQSVKSMIRIEPELSTAGESSHIDTETKIITSWPIVSEAVDAIGVNAFVEYKTSPYARALVPVMNCIRSKLGTEAVAPVTHTLRLDQFMVPDNLLGQKFLLRVQEEGGYILYGPDGRELLRSEVAQASTTTAEKENHPPIAIKVGDISAEAGEEYVIRPVTRENYIRQIQRDLSAERVGVRNSNGIIEVQFSASDAEFAKRFLDVLTNIYTQKSLQRSARGKIKALANLKLRNEQIEKKLKTAESELEGFRKQQNAIDLPQESMAKIRLAAELQSKLADLEVQKAELLSTRTEQHPSVKALNDQVAAYQAQIDEIEAALGRMPEIERQLFQLTREVETNKQMYQANSVELNRLTNEVSGITGYAQILSQAIPEKNGLLFKVIGAGFLGGAFAIFLSLAFILVRNTAFFAVIRTPEMLRMAAKLPVIAAIPRSSGIDKKYRGLTTYLIETQDKAAGVLKELEAKIKYITYGAGNNVLLLTSDVEHQGKSFVSSNFALLSAGHRRTLLIDADVVKGSLHQNFTTQRAPGFSDLIVGKASIDQVLTNPIEDKLWFIPAGTEVPSHNLLHDYDKLKSLMQALSTRFDLIVVDYPAVMTQIDDPDMLKFAGTIFLVVRQGESAARVKRFLAKYPQGLAKVSAIILNDVVNP